MDRAGRAGGYGEPVLGARGRPEVCVNQLGYLQGAPKRAVWLSDAREPAPFRARDGGGGEVLRGWTEPWPVRPDPSSGLAVHVLDFSALRAEGAGFTIEVEGARSRAFAIARDLYRRLVRDALGFFYLQRSGIAIDEARAPGYGRPPGHPGDVAVEAWTGPDAERLYPGWSCPGGFDVSGGWYDAGDHGKYVTSGAMPVWQLLATVELLRRRRAGTDWWAQTEALLLEECRWQLDWLLRMQVPAGRRHAGLAFHRVHGSEWAPLPCWPHQDPTTRVLHRPSTAAALHLAAAAAHGARVWRDDRVFAGRLLDAAVTAYRAARAEPLLLAPDDEGAFGGGPYADDDVADEFAWAAAELWLATGDPAYGKDAGRALEPEAFDVDGFDWNRMAAAAALDLALHGEALDDHDRAVANVVAAADRLVDLEATQPWGQPYAPAGG
jgi:endoglucanase